MGDAEGGALSPRQPARKSSEKRTAQETGRIGAGLWTTGEKSLSRGRARRLDAPAAQETVTDTAALTVPVPAYSMVQSPAAGMDAGPWPHAGPTVVGGVGFA